MTIAAGDRLFCDTNVLLTAVASQRSLNQQALHILNVLPNAGVELCISGQVVREFLVVCTRPIEVNGLGLSTALAIDNIKAVLGRTGKLFFQRLVNLRCPVISGLGFCRLARLCQ